MAFLGPDGRPIRSFGNFGTRRKVRVDRLEPGMMLCEHILGFRRKVLVAEGEVLTKKHVDQLNRWIARPGAGCLLQYTREVWVKACLASGEERPRAESDPYAAHSVQKWYRSHNRVSLGPKRMPGATRVLTIGADGKTTYHGEAGAP